MNRFELQKQQDNAKLKSDKVMDIMNDISIALNSKNKDIISLRSLSNRAEKLAEELLTEAKTADSVKQATLLQNASVLKFEAKKLTDLADTLNHASQSREICNNINNTVEVMDFKKRLEEGL